MPEPMRIFCGADRSQQLPFEVLAHSIRRHASRACDIRTIDNALAPPVSDPRHAPYTEFSFGRFAIPELCGHAGRALYMDSDMLVFRDIAEAFDVPFDGAKILIEAGSRDARDRGKHAAFMLLDCARLPWRVAEIVAGLGTRYDYNELLSLDPLVAPGEIAERIPAGWNSLDAFDPATTRNIHYTEIRTQPWVDATHPQGGPWVRELLAMLGAGAIDAQRVREEVELGHARPSLLIELGIEPGAADPASLSAHDRAAGYVAHRTLLERFAARKRAARLAERDAAIARTPWLAPWYRLRHAIRG
ncbi:MAG TPA: glycosyl transferase [Candidatus Saccharimonadia bacterium]|nr:glycosyl transferase [Candidatus Saccharimonadia bacterium]